MTGAEDSAARFLERHGLQVIGRNYRTRLGEIDLIARDAAVLVDALPPWAVRTGAEFAGMRETADGVKCSASASLTSGLWLATTAGSSSRRPARPPHTCGTHR